MHRLARSTGATLALALFVLAFVHPHAGAALVPRPAAGASAGVSMIFPSFIPASLTIGTGTTVKWTNNEVPGSFSQHTSTEDGITPTWDSGALTAGQSFSRTFATPGVFHYHCSVHPFSMTGTITVVAFDHFVDLPLITQ